MNIEDQAELQEDMSEPFFNDAAPLGEEQEASTIVPSFTDFERALLSRLAYHMSTTDMSAENIEALGRVFVQRIEAKMIRLRDGQLKHGGDFLKDVDHDNERRQEMDDAEWYDIAAIVKGSDSLHIKL